MSVIRTMYTGVSGLSSNAEAISTTGDNITNANTIGFKRSRSNFEDVLARSVGGGAGDVGIGTRIANVQKMLTQGAMLGTGQATDLAMKGDGFFVVKGNVGGVAGQFYTRAGQFVIDKDGYLVNQQGLRMQGYGVDAQGNLRRQVSDVQIPTAQIPPGATSQVSLVANLASSATTPTTAFSAANASAGSNFSTQVTVYDSLGQAHAVNVYFRREAGAGAWSWHAVSDGADLTGGTAGTPQEIATGTLAFDTQGRLQSAATTSSAFNFVNAVQGQAITFNFGDPIGSGGTGLRGMTSYASPSATTFIDQNGYASGSLAGISIGSDGIISGVFSNGLKRTVGQVLVADFQAPEEMQRIGGNLWTETAQSGQAMVGEPGSGGRGGIVSGALEQSNVDLAQEFVDMITYQRGFQASSRTITTADEMYQEVLSLKR
ncbi:MAG: flagellar hook protein FlgE [Deltaproteobacteria bacterium]|nr:flagellar hook protein FlgE [Deltaproteobacteria bacterium]